MELSEDQQRALNSIIEWYRNGSTPYLTLGGYAGTGKTTLVGELVNEDIVPGRTVFAAYTGKAAQVLRKKLRDAGVNLRLPDGEDAVSTLHKLIYLPMEQKICKATGEYVYAGERQCGPHAGTKGDCEVVKRTTWRRRDSLPDWIGLIIVDEASMVTRPIWDDLLSYDIPVLAIGDHGQLPPVGGSFNLMQDPEIRLERIHRQAEGSPIITMSRWAREQGDIPFGEYGPGVLKLPRERAGEVPFNPDALVLTGMNRTRVAMNKMLRARSGFGLDGQLVQEGEKVICLKNDRREGIWNGMPGKVTHVGEQAGVWAELGVALDDGGNYLGRAHAGQFAREKTLMQEDREYVPGLSYWDYGYAITVHKAQGSQAEEVLVFEERLPGGPEKHARWLYTAVTRASERVVVLG